MRLLFITSTRIGDAVLSTGALGHLLEAHPGIRVTVAVGRVAAPLFEAVPTLERVIVIKKRRFSLHWPELWSKVAGQRWDIVVDLRKSALAYFLAARRRVITGSRGLGPHRVEEVAGFLGLDHVPAPRLWLAPKHRQVADRLVSTGRQVLALGPVANWRGKQWPAARFAELAQRLTAENGPLPGAAIAIFAAPHEKPQAQRVVALLPQDSVIDLVGAGDLLTIAACFERCRVFVGNDSGLMHMAAAMGTPTLGLFGPSRDDRYRPWGPHAGFVRTAQSSEELFARLDDDPAALEGLMDDLTVDAAEEGARALLARCEVA